MNLKMTILEGTFGVCKLRPDESEIQWIKGDFYSITQTQDELSVLCLEKYIPKQIKYEGNWRCIKVEGQLDFSLIGILAFISTTLAKKGISIFALSTYNTDYILVKEKKLMEAKEALQEAGVIF